MWKKLAVAMVVAGAMSLGSVGVAVAAPASGSPAGGTGTPGAGKHLTCANAPKLLGRVDNREARIATRLPKLKAAEQQAQGAGKTALAQRIEKRIDRLTKLQAKGNDVIAKIEARCPNAAPVNPNPGTGATGTSGVTSGAGGTTST